MLNKIVVTQGRSRGVRRGGVQRLAQALKSPPPTPNPMLKWNIEIYFDPPSSFPGTCTVPLGSVLFFYKKMFGCMFKRL